VWKKTFKIIIAISEVRARMTESNRDSGWCPGFLRSLRGLGFEEGVESVSIKEELTSLVLVELTTGVNSTGIGPYCLKIA
jgi:hypothetical protein